MTLFGCLALAQLAETESSPKVTKYYVSGERCVSLNNVNWNAAIVCKVHTTSFIVLNQVRVETKYLTKMLYQLSKSTLQHANH